MADIQNFTDDEVSGIGIGPEHGIAKARLNSVIDRVNELYDNHVQATMAELQGHTDENEVSGALNGKAANAFMAREIVVVCTGASGSIAGDGTLNIGTTSGGNDILAAGALTGLDAAGKARRLTLTADTYNILGNATLYANIESEDSTATSLLLTVHVLGEQF